MKSPLLSKIVDLTKHILLRPDAGFKQPSAQFFAGRQTPRFVSGGVGLEWWYSEGTFQAIETVARLAISGAREFKDCDIETACRVVTTTLQQKCVDSSLFNIDQLGFGPHRTLFECRATDVPHLATAIAEAIAHNLRAGIGKRCTIYVVPRLQSPSFRIAGEPVRLIARDDDRAWNALIDEGYLFDGWAPSHPTTNFATHSALAPPSGFSCVLVAEQTGTADGTRFASLLSMRRLLAIVVATACVHQNRTFFKSMAQPLDFCIQFPHVSCPDSGYVRTTCEPLLPYFASDVVVDTHALETVVAWYAAWSKCGEPARGRIEKGAHFLNRGMNSDNFEAFVGTFVALDALFGERGSVEQSILAGVRSLDIDPSYTEKAGWLFELRSELVHGGSRHISEWTKYLRYTEHFRTDPMADVVKLAQLAVLRAPQVFGRP
jgi:hypothetical protein